MIDRYIVIDEFVCCYKKREDFIEDCRVNFLLSFQSFTVFVLLFTCLFCRIRSFKEREKVGH